jgi:hypothetical protein
MGHEKYEPEAPPRSNRLRACTYQCLEFLRTRFKRGARPERQSTQALVLESTRHKPNSMLANDMVCAINPKVLDIRIIARPIVPVDIGTVKKSRKFSVCDPMTPVLPNSNARAGEVQTDNSPVDMGALVRIARVSEG